MAKMIKLYDGTRDVRGRANIRQFYVNSLQDARNAFVRFKKKNPNIKVAYYNDTDSGVNIQL